MDEGVCVPWLFWTRYDPNAKNIVLLEALLWREIVVENYYGYGLLTMD